MKSPIPIICCWCALLLGPVARAGALEPVDVEGQPLAANVQRLREALQLLGAPLSMQLNQSLDDAAKARDAVALQKLLDPHVLGVVGINPETRVKVARGPASARLQQAGYSPVLVKVINHSLGTQPLRLTSPQAGPVYAGVAKLSMERQGQTHLRENENTEGSKDRFLEAQMFNSPPMTAQLSGLAVEYAIALIHSGEAGKREATLVFDVGQGTQDLGFRAELPVLFDVQPAVKVTLKVQDFDGVPTMGRFLFTDAQGHVFPPQAKRLEPDLFFQKHIYRADGETVLLPPGHHTMMYGRGPEYRWLKREITVPAAPAFEVAVKLERWVNPAAFGFYSGDHHIHAAGCAHYTSPTEGVEPAHMFRQIKGEALNVGCVLTWAYGFEHQSPFCVPTVNELSEPLTRMKYDMEVSGFGSAGLGHVCLLHLKQPTYPGSQGIKGWPSWTLPTLRWTKANGGYTGYAHSGSGLEIKPDLAAKRLLEKIDTNKDGRLDRDEASRGFLPEPFEKIDANHDALITEVELIASHDRISDQLPNIGIPELNSSGAQEIFVTTALGACDFISAMDTARLREWNCWYHLMNCGFPLKVSGETDFPCMSGTRVGQGRVYVQLGPQKQVDFDAWCEGLAKGRSYVSDGYAHALAFTVNDHSAGTTVELEKATPVTVKTTVSFSAETPLEVAYGGTMPVGGKRFLGDTVVLHESQGPGVFANGKRLVELVVNGRAVAHQEVPADGKPHDIAFTAPIELSSWVAIRQFPQLHTNPVNVIIGGKPIRASKSSALWAIACIDQLWAVCAKRIAPAERGDAEKAYEQAREVYRRIAAESPAG